MSFGDASLLGAVYQHGVKWTSGKIAGDADKVSPDRNARTTETPTAFPLNAYQTSMDKMGLFCKEDCNLQCFSIRTVGLANSFPRLLKLNVAINALLNTGNPANDYKNWENHSQVW